MSGLFAAIAGFFSYASLELPAHRGADSTALSNPNFNYYELPQARQNRIFRL
ncbi:hypothetical protein ACVWYF_003248 [Hymenobacter sp. UYAg731]